MVSLISKLKIKMLYRYFSILKKWKDLLNEMLITRGNLLLTSAQWLLCWYLILDPNIMTFPAYLFPPMCEHELINTLPWRPCNSISSLNLLTKIGPKTPHLRSRDPCEHTKTYEAFNDSGFPGSHSPSLTRTSSTNVSTSKWVNLLQFH